MNPRAPIWVIFAKDGRELLRDRRALFVNLVLPMLLYPVLLLFAVQVAQVTQAQPRQRPRVGLVGAPSSLRDRLQQAAVRSLPALDGTPALAPPLDATRALFDVHDLGADATQLGALAAELDWRGGDPKPDAAWKARAVASLRARQLVQAVVMPAVSARTAPLLVAQDSASSDLFEVSGPVDRAIGRWRRDLVERELTRRGQPVALLDPVVVHSVGAATLAEAVRTHAAPMLPFIVLVLAVAAAMAPAVDLVAGERDRGTLEMLLSLPVRRRDLVVGKLLVVLAASVVAVVLNLLSLALTAGLLAGQLPALGSESPLAGILQVGLPALGLALVMLVPVVALVAAAGVALSGYAQSVKEAQMYLTPLMLVVTFVGLVAVVPHARPTLALDLIPVAGTLLALREALQSPTVPWLHLGVASLANGAAALVLVGWCAQMFDREAFRYPRLVRAGWGRFARFRRGEALPDGPEALLVFAVAVAGMTLGGGLLSEAPPWLLVTVPLLGFVALPALGHAWLGAYPLPALGLRWPGWNWVGAAALLAPVGAALSLGLGWLQAQWVDTAALQQASAPVEKAVQALDAAGGIPLQVLCLAVLPAVCEELLCRGTLLVGITRSLGRNWGVVLSAVLFALLHQSPLRLLPQAVLGLLLAGLTLRARSLLPAVVVHAGHNALLVVANGYGWLPND